MHDRRAVTFVYAATAALAIAGAWFVSAYGSPVPVMDEWDLLGEWIASDSTAQWLIAHHNEHRYPVTKLLWLGGLRAAGYKPKPLLFVPLGLLVAASVLLLMAARTIRGRQHVGDVMVPALLLHWGHGFNWLMAYQLGFALVAFAVAGWVWCAARGRMVGSLAFAALLVPCGGFGLAFAPPVVLWCAWVAWRSRGRVAVVAVVLGVSTAGYTAWVVITMPEKRLSTAGVKPTDAPVAFAAAAAGELSVGVGVWPARDGLSVRVTLALAVIGVYTWAVVRAVRTRTPFAVAGCCVILGTGLTAAAMAVARGTGFTERMADASAAGLATAWVLAVTTTTSLHRTLGVLAIAAAVGLFWANITESRGYARALHHSAYRVNRDLRSGVPPLVIVGRHGHSHSVLVGDRLGPSLLRLKAAGVRPFDALPDDPAFVAQPAYHPARLAAGEHEFPAPPPGAFAVRVRAVSERVTDRERAVLRWTDPVTGTEHEDESWVPPLVMPFEMVFPLRGRFENLRLVLGGAVLDLRVESIDHLLPAPK